MNVILGKDIMESKIIHTDYEEESSTVSDILLNMDSKNLCYLTLKLKKPTHEMDDEKSRSFLKMLNPFSHPDKMEKQLFLIPKVQIDRIEPGTVVMKGTKVEEEREQPMMDCRSYSLVINTKVETQSGEKVGKINDIVLDKHKRELIGLQLDGTLHEGSQYLPYEGIVEFNSEKLIIADHLLGKLVNEPEQLS